MNEPGPPVAICVNLQLQPVSATVGPGGVSIRVQSTGGTATGKTKTLCRGQLRFTLPHHLCPHVLVH